MVVTETFFALQVQSMERAIAFYTGALGATASYTSPAWTSLHIAGVRVGLALSPDMEPTHTGLHFAVDDLAGARATVEAAGGHATAPTEVAPGVVLADATDPEGNTFTLRGP